MKLTLRRKVRRVLLDVPYGTSAVVAAALLGVAGLGLYTETDSVLLFGILAFFGFLFVRDEADADICPTCRAKVNAFDDRYCVTCGDRLDELPAAPPIDDRVDERYRPVGLSELENPELPAPSPATDGGEERSEGEES